jgi:hypothetical protein
MSKGATTNPIMSKGATTNPITSTIGGRLEKGGALVIFLLPPFL